LIKADFGNQLPRLFELLRLPNAERRADLDAVLGDSGDGFSNGLGLTIRDEWTCLFGFEVNRAFHENRLSMLASHADFLAWSLEGTCGYGAYQWWKQGKLLREWAEIEGKVLTDFGPPPFKDDELTPEEVNSEDRVFQAMQAVAQLMCFGGTAFANGYAVGSESNGRLVPTLSPTIAFFILQSRNTES
jgi:hypothetical protein